MLRTIWTSVLPIAAVIGIVVPTISPTQVDASCGSVSCFVVIGSQQQVPMKGLLTVNAIYNWTPMEAPSGEGGRIPFANQGAKTLTLANLNVNRIETTTRTATLDLNYGLTERLGIQGSYGRFAQGTTLAESTLQIGRGNFGVVPMIYQTYELIPHRLNQFALASYRYTAKNSDGYKFGDEVNVSLGLNAIPFEKTPWLVLMQQFNFRWMQNDAMDAALFQFNPNTGGSILLDPAIKFREVPTTGSTYLAYSPGIMVNVFNFASAYFIAQIPIHRDFNGNLEQQISYIFGVTKSFQLFGGSS
jgi:hypothetical protein